MAELLNIIAVDDEELALLNSKIEITKALDESVYKGSYVLNCFQNALQALEYVKHNSCAIAFLDIGLLEMTGIELAKQIKIFNPSVNIIFTTAYDEYANSAFDLHASGYVLKPVTATKIKAEVDHLRYGVSVKATNRLRACTFGNFEVFVNDEPLKFKYTKSKELLAFLIDRRGSLVSNKELMASLWEDGSDNHFSYLKKIRTDLTTTLKEYGQDGILNQQWGSMGIKMDMIECDYYDWLAGKIEGINAYNGEYMSQYSWGELTHGNIEMRMYE